MRDLTETRDAILRAALAHAPFDGWTRKTMRLAAKDAGYDETMAERVFAGGPVAIVEYLSEYADRRMAEELERLGLAGMRVRERITLALHVRFGQWAPHREALRRALSLLAMPQNAGAMLRSTYRTVDAIWYAAGDTATDFSFYTKRATLAAVYTSTVLYWLDDQSENAVDTWAFLDRRLDDVMRIPKMRARVEERLRGLPVPWRLFGRGRGRRRFGPQSLRP